MAPREQKPLMLQRDQRGLDAWQFAYVPQQPLVGLVPISKFHSELHAWSNLTELAYPPKELDFCFHAMEAVMQKLLYVLEFMIL
jgi:hypothetical protein